MDGGLLSLYEADEDAISWMKMTATKAFAKGMDGWLGFSGILSTQVVAISCLKEL